MTRELDNRAPHEMVMKEISKIMVKQNPKMTPTPQAARASNPPRLEQVRRDFLKKMKLRDGIAMSLSRFTIEE